MKSARLSIAVGATLAASVQFAIAQTGAAPPAPVKPAYKIPDNEKPADKPEPTGIKLDGGVTLKPYFNLALGRDDNLFLTRSNAKSSDMQIYNPGFKLEVDGQVSRFGFGYDLEVGKYSSSSSDDYTDYKIFGVGEFVMSQSMGLKLAADYNVGHDPRGSTDRGIAGVPDEFRTSGPSALFAYGANDAMGRVEIEAGAIAKRYLNNRSTTVTSDRDNDRFAGRVFLRVAPKSSLLVEGRREKVDYSLSTSSQDSKETRFLVGVTWDATAATSGTVKVGQIKKDFDSVSRKDFSGTGWEASINWKPVTYSAVDLFTTKSFNESTGVGNFILNKRYGTVWNHKWGSQLTSAVTLTRSDDEFAGDERKDKTDSLGLKLNYKVMRWFVVGGEYTSSKRESSQSIFNYKKNVFMLTFDVEL
jgi:hypothetical protein